MPFVGVQGYTPCYQCQLGGVEYTLEEGAEPVVFGPDGLAVTPETCTQDRFASSCCVAAAHTVREMPPVYAVVDAGAPARADAGQPLEAR